MAEKKRPADLPGSYYLANTWQIDRVLMRFRA
jgi:hypothetical protein